MHLSCLTREELECIVRLAQLALDAGPCDQVGFTPEELNLRSALESLEDPKLSELLAGARIEPARYQDGLAQEAFREQMLKLETHDTSYLLERLMQVYDRIPVFAQHVEWT